MAPLATTSTFLKRNGFRASPADYRRPFWAKNGRPSDCREIGPSRGAGSTRITSATSASPCSGRRAPGVAARGARRGRALAAPMGARVPRGEREVSSPGARAGLAKAPTLRTPPLPTNSPSAATRASHLSSSPAPEYLREVPGRAWSSRIASSGAIASRPSGATVATEI